MEGEDLGVSVWSGPERCREAGWGSRAGLTMTRDLKDFFKSENLWRHKKAESEALDDGALIF